MASEQIDRARWAPFFDDVTRSLVGKLAEIEVASLDLGDQVAAQWVPLVGITYDHKDDLIEIALDQFDHLIRRPRLVLADTDAGGVVAIAVIDGDGNRQIARFRDLLMLPAQSTVASRQTS